MSGYVHIHNKKKITQSLVTKGLDNIISTAKVEYSINFTAHKQNFFQFYTEWKKQLFTR